MNRYKSFAEFWPFYVSQHLNRTNRDLHFIGITLALLCLSLVPISYWFLLLPPILGYGFAWAGHFFFEKNRPATFQYPVWSLMGDFKMYGLMWRWKMYDEIKRIQLASDLRIRSTERTSDVYNRGD